MENEKVDEDNIDIVVQTKFKEVNITFINLPDLKHNN